MFKEGRFKLDVFLARIEEFQGFKQVPLVPDHEIRGEDAKGPALTLMAVNKNRATLFFGFFNKGNSGTNNILFDDILYIILRPLISEEINTIELGGVLRMLTCTIDNMRDLIHLEPFDILFYAGGYLCNVLIGHEDAVADFGGDGEELVGVGLGWLGLLCGGFHVGWIINWKGN